MARKHRDHFDLCKTPDDVLDYLMAHGGHPNTAEHPNNVRQTGSHIIVKGPSGSVGIQCNHRNEQLQRGILTRLEREMVAAGFELVH